MLLFVPQPAVSDTTTPKYQNASDADADSDPQTAAKGYNTVSTSDEGNITAPSTAIQDDGSDEGLVMNSRPLVSNLCCVELWLMWVVSFAVWGAGSVVTANSSQIYQALDPTNFNEKTATVYVSVFGIANAIGRIAVGFLQRRLTHQSPSRVVYLFLIAPLVFTVDLPLFLLLPAKALILPFFLAGAAFGASWGSTVLLIKALYFPSTCGQHYNMLFTAGMVHSLVLNVGLFAPNYDRHAAADHVCRGTVCILMPLMVLVALNLVAVVAAFWFIVRIRHRRGVR